jgi:hypothetical protein
LVWYFCDHGSIGPGFIQNHYRAHRPGLPPNAPEHLLDDRFVVQCVYVSENPHRC